MNETPIILFLLTGAALFALGFRGLFVDKTGLRRILAVNIMGMGVFLVFITLAARAPGQAPDPVPHAMVLTGIRKDLLQLGHADRALEGMHDPFLDVLLHMTSLDADQSGCLRQAEKMIHCFLR